MNVLSVSPSSCSIITDLFVQCLVCVIHYTMGRIEPLLKKKKKIQGRQFKTVSEGFFYVLFVEKVLGYFHCLVSVLIFDQ